MKYRYALFHNPVRSEPWLIVAQYKFLWSWSDSFCLTFTEKEDAIESLEALAQKEIDDRLEFGQQLSEWRP